MGRQKLKAITPEKQAEFLALISSGEATYKAALIVDVPKAYWYELASRDSTFRELLSRAREEQQEALVDEMREMADSCDESNVNSTKLKIWAAQWIAAKRAPKKFGDKQSVELSGANGGPLTVKWEK